MMRKTLLVAFSLFVSAGVLYASAAPVAACSCAYITDADQIRAQLEDWDGLVVEGAIAAPQGAGPETMRFAVEIAYWGEPPSEIVLDQTWEPPYHAGSVSYENLGADCSYSLTGEAGDRYVLYLSPSESLSGAFGAAGCASFPLAYVEEGEPHMANPYAFRYDALLIATDGGMPVVELAPDDGAVIVIDDRIDVTGEDGDAPQDVTSQEEAEEHDEDASWAVILPLAFGIPLATLLLQALLRRRSAGS